MKRPVFLALIFIACAVVIIAFFKPWAQVGTSITGVSQDLAGIAEKSIGGKVVGELQKATTAISGLGDMEVKTTVRGYDIPILVNDKTSKMAISIAEILFKSAEDLDIKSYLVYLAPILALLCAFLAFKGTKLYVLIMVIISGVLSVAGIYNVSTANLSNMIVKVKIGQGIWLTLYAFLFMAIVGIIWFIMEKKRAV